MRPDQSCSVTSRKRPRLRAEDWDGESYGYGTGRAHFCVRDTVCPACGRGPGQLCAGPQGICWVTHADRREVWRVARFREKKTKKTTPLNQCTTLKGCSNV